MTYYFIPVVRSAPGTKQTRPSCRSMSAFGGKADNICSFCFSAFDLGHAKTRGGLASLSYSNRANRLECQTGVHGNFDPQRLSGALANRANAVTGQMATWREWRAWRREFKSLGIRQVREREAHSIWHEEKQQAARWWLWEQELLPYVLAALATLIVGLIAWLK